MKKAALDDKDKAEQEKAKIERIQTEEKLKALIK